MGPIKQRTYLPLFFFLTLGSLAMYPVSTVEVRAERSGQLLFLGLAKKNRFFELRYIHSVEKIPVDGKFEVLEDGALRCLETRIPSFGPGLPFANLRKEDGGYFSHRSQDPGGFENIRLVVSLGSEQVLTIGDKVLRLGDLPHGELVTIGVKKRPWLEVIWRNGG